MRMVSKEALFSNPLQIPNQFPGFVRSSQSIPFQFSSVPSSPALLPNPDQARLPANAGTHAMLKNAQITIKEVGRDEVKERGNLVSSHS